MFGHPRRASQDSDAPLKVVLEAWPDQMRARATVTRNGQAQDLEVKAPILKMILAALRA